MNTKENRIIDALKQISDDQNGMAGIAKNDNHHMAALYAQTIAAVTAEAAEIIEKQAAELTVLRTQPVTRLNLSDTGRCIYIIDQEPQQYIILAELQDKYLITSYPMRESEIMTNIRLIKRTQAVFIDGTQRAVLNA
ncbi:hypothetical protein ABVX93_002551 [Escherichia coli]|nr:hypothetical protein [Escherichia coli]